MTLPFLPGRRAGNLQADEQTAGKTLQLKHKLHELHQFRTFTLDFFSFKTIHFRTSQNITQQGLDFYSNRMKQDQDYNFFTKQTSVILLEYGHFL